MLVVINNTEVHFSVKDSAVHASSLEVAKVFEKEHKNILRSIENMGVRAQLNFELSEYKDGSGRKLPMYQMNRDGFAFLVMGFTGAKAEDWKLDFIEAFNKLEMIARRQANQSPATSLQPTLTVDKSCQYWREAYYRAFEGRCFYTGKSLNPQAFHIDHICPSSRGGWDAIDNLVLCDPSYNIQKGAMTDMARIAKDQEIVRTKYAHIIVMHYHSLKNNLVSPLVNPTQLLNRSTMEGLERYFGKAAMRDFYAKLIPGLRTDLVEANVVDESDTINEFIRMCLARSNEKIATRTVYEAYLEWCRLNNSEAIPLKELSRKIALKMAVPNKPVSINGKTTRAFVGVSIVSLGEAS